MLEKMLFAEAVVFEGALEGNKSRVLIERTAKGSRYFLIDDNVRAVSTGITP